MRMLMIIMKESIEEEIRKVLRENHVAAFTEMHEATGQGEAGITMNSLSWPGFHNVIFAALSEPEAGQVIAALEKYRDHLAARQHGAKIPLRVFSLPCEMVV